MGARPKVGPDKELTDRVTALVLPEETAAMELLARKEGRTVSAYLRRVVQAHIAEAKAAKQITDEDIKAQIKSWSAKS